jgi:ATP-dependent RNA helicase DDX55/SPB4
VLDEADQLLDLGMSAAITAILSKLPKQRRTGLFSATQTREVKALARAGLRNPAIISVAVQHNASTAASLGAEAQRADTGSGQSRGGDRATKDEGAAAPHSFSSGGTSSARRDVTAGAVPCQSTPTALTNYFQVCATPLTKLAALLRFLSLRARAGEKVIIFVLTCASVDFYGLVSGIPEFRAVCGLPPAAAFPIIPLHGKMAPKKRTSAYDAFVAAGSGALLCTDIAARGIDVPDVEWIVQYDPPKDPAFYIHRVGRTARAGRSGSSLLLLLPKEQSYLQLLMIKSVPIQSWDVLRSAESFPRGVVTSAAATAAFEDTEGIGLAACSAMQAAAVADRDVLEKGTAAFVAFVRGCVSNSANCYVLYASLRVPCLTFVRSLNGAGTANTC